MRSGAILGVAVALAFAVRVAPAYHAVLTPAGTNFQDNDSWFHMRSVHNLLAHYPWQNAFDPYALFPGGQVLYTEPWDTAIASVAWILGAGAPSAPLTDQIGAWLPAILGAMLPIPVFFLGRRLFGELAAQLSAFAVAVIPGTLLWETHLGVPDHHVAECLLSLTVLTLLCGAAELHDTGRTWRVVLAGLLFGLYICVRPAGIFVPGTLAAAALLEPVLSPLLAGAVALGSVVFLTSQGNKWSRYTWLALAGSLLICLFAWALERLWRKKQWRGSLLRPAALGAVLVTAGIVVSAKPSLFLAFAANIRRFLPGGQDLAAVNSIRELYPIWKMTPGGVAALTEMLGGVWILALPAMVCAIPVAWLTRRPALTLFTMWGTVMTIAGILQLRMMVYAGPVIALAAGAGAAWVIGRFGAPMKRFRTAASVAFVAFVVATSLPAAIRQTEWNGGPDTQWRSALRWLSQNTPEPMGGPDAWWRQWPRLRPGEKFRYPASSYGVLAWWDYGDWINAIAHRLPSSNGTQINADEIAGFLTATGPGVARDRLMQLAARYVVLNPEVVTTLWPTIVLWAGDDDARFRKVVYSVGADGTGVPVILYLPDYFRSMAVHMFLFDGRAITASPEVSVFITRRESTKSGASLDVVIGERKFHSQKEAYDYMAANAAETLIFGSADPTQSCVELEDLPWVKPVFASDQIPMRADRAPHTVKVFEVAP